MDTENIGILVESESTCTKEALDNVVKEVSRMEREELIDREREGEGRSAAWPRQKYHFTLIRCVCAGSTGSFVTAGALRSGWSVKPRFSFFLSRQSSCAREETFFFVFPWESCIGNSWFCH